MCRGAGKAFVPMSIMLGVWCVFRILYITVMMQWRHEIVYVYWAYPITWAISSVIYLFYFLFSNWQDRFDPQPEGRATSTITTSIWDIISERSRKRIRGSGCAFRFPRRWWNKRQ